MTASNANFAGGVTLVDKDNQVNDATHPIYFAQAAGVLSLETSATGVAVAQSGNTTLITIDVGGLSRIFVEIAVTSQALDAFVIQATAPSGSFQSLYSAAGDYTSPSGLLVGTSGDLTIIAAGASGWFIMDVSGLDQVRLLASSGNAAGSTVSVYVGGA